MIIKLENFQLHFYVNFTINLNLCFLKNKKKSQSERVQFFLRNHRAFQNNN